MRRALHVPGAFFIAIRPAKAMLDFEYTRSPTMQTVTDNFLSIGELSNLTGLTAHTLRFYESAGILLPIARGANGHRRYRSDDVLWLAFVLRLKRTGMPLAEIRQYAQLRTDGETSLSARLAMLELHRERLAAKMAELSDCADALDDKIRTYRKMIATAKAPRKRRTR
jgi:DNA-binding transcriptional MerR regulator